MAPHSRRILVVSNFFSQGYGGTPESVLLLARELAPSGIAVDVFCNKGLVRDAQNFDALPAADDPIPFFAAPSVRDYAALFIAGSWSRRAPLLALKAVLAGVPITYAAKGCLCRIEFERLRDMRRIPYFLLLEWPLLAFARRIVFSSRVERQAYVVPTWLWRRRAVQLEEPFRGGALGAETAPAPIPTLGFLAEISSRKGLLELIDGLGHYLAQHKNAPVRLRIAGQVRRGSQGYLNACRGLAERNGAAAHIEWCEPVRGEARADFYRSLDLFLCPSRFESFGLTPLEALWQGTPVCLGPALGVLEYLSPDAPLLRLASLRKEDIAGAIAAFLDNVRDWRDKRRAWEGRHAMMRSNAEIAQDFARILLDAPA
jgi:glycosyltransferase involved in cell wall biosynthesis